MPQTTTAPFPYQAKGVRKIHHFGGRALIADEMGLGKTLQSLLFAHEVSDARPIIAICPASLKWNWEREAIDHIGMRSHVIEGRTPPLKFKLRHPLVIINYDLLQYWLWELLQLQPQLVILDECHKLGNKSTIQTKTSQRLCRDVPYVLGLSGTPLMNRPAELFSVLHILRPEIYNSRTAFEERYCKREWKPWGWQAKGATNVEELHKKLLTTCFPFATQIRCREGMVPIGTIVEEKRVTEVLCYDHSSNQICWRPILAHSKRTSPSRLVRVKHTRGEFISTCDHLVWTTEGYQRAETLAPGVLLSSLSKEIQSPDTRTPNHNPILFDSMLARRGNPKRKSLNKNDDDKMGTTATNFPSLSELQRTDQTKILFHPMLATIQRSPGLGGSQRSIQNSSRSLQMVFQENHTERPQFIKTTNSTMETLQPLLCSTHTLVQNQNRESNSPPLENLAASKKTPQGIRMAGIVPRSWNSFPSFERSIREGETSFSDGRSCQEEIQIGNRSRWAEPHDKTTTGTRQLENFSTGTSRVESVEILQPGNRRWPFNSSEENQVYDIEVEGCHNFFANGTLVHNCMIRRRKKDVLQDLPTKSRHVVTLDVPDRQEYDAAERDFIGWLMKHSAMAARKANKAEALVKMGYLKRLAARCKLPSVLDWIDEFLAESDEKLILFGIHKTIIRTIHERYQRQAVFVDGSVIGKDRQHAVNQFNDNTRTRLFIGNIQAAGVGWNCTSSSVVAFAELGWKPGEHTQGEDRVHGIKRGQEGIRSRAYYLIGRNTVESDLCRLLQEKQRVLDGTLDGIVGDEDSLDIFDQLTNCFSKSDRRKV